MTDEQIEQQGAPDQPTEQVEQQEQTSEQDSRPEGWDRVDFQKDDREVIEQRFHRLYGQVKRSDSVQRQLLEDNRKLMERLDQFENTTREKEEASQIADIRQQIAEATETGDGAKVAALTDKLVELRTPKPQKAPEPEPPVMDDGTIAVLSEWAQETDAEGKPKRPWLKDPEIQQKAVQATQTVLTDPRFSHLSMLQKLNLVEQQFAPKKQEVLTGGDRPPPEPKGPKLSKERKAVAWKMFSDLPKADAEKKYAKGMGS